MPLPQEPITLSSGSRNQTPKSHSIDFMYAKKYPEFMEASQLSKNLKIYQDVGHLQRIPDSLKSTLGLTGKISHGAKLLQCSGVQVGWGSRFFLSKVDGKAFARRTRAHSPKHAQQGHSCLGADGSQVVLILPHQRGEARQTSTTTLSYTDSTAMSCGFLMMFANDLLEQN